MGTPARPALIWCAEARLCFGILDFYFPTSDLKVAAACGEEKWESGVEPPHSKSSVSRVAAGHFHDGDAVTNL